MAINRTGTPNPSDYTLGRGEAFFALNDPATGKPKGFRSLGNLVSLTATMSAELKTHESSRGGIKTTDVSIPLSQTMSVTIVGDERSHQNMALAFSGEIGDVAGTTGTTPTVNGAKVASTNVKIVSSVQKGYWYELTNAVGNRLYDIVAANLTVKKGTAGVPGATLAINTDYQIDVGMGRIFILSTAPGIAEGDEAYFSYTADAAAKDTEVVRALTKSSISGHLVFIESNAGNNGKRREFAFHAVDLSPSGDFGLISDTWGEYTLTGTAGSNLLGYPTSPVLTITDHLDS